MEIKEIDFENEVIERLQKNGWNIKEDVQRDSYAEVFDYQLLENKIMLINNIDKETAKRAIGEIRKNNDEIITMNKRSYKFLIEGIKIPDEKNKITRTIKIISEDSSKNSYDAVRQFIISNNKEKRIPDIVLFINGLPVVIMELKSPLANDDIQSAFNQNESLKYFCPKLWSFNIINFISTRTITKYGGLTSKFKRYHSVKNLITRDEKNIIDFLFSFENIYKFITLYSFYVEEKNSNIKYIAAPHQIEAVEATIKRLKSSDKKGGVIWHTQGSGKSVTMLILSKAIINNFSNSTLLIVTDRKDLDNQLLGRFLNAEEYLRNKPVQIKTRKDMIDKLNDKKHFGIYFSTVQKFVEETGELSKRDDIFILVDEAHRSQNNIDGETTLSKEKKELITKYGYGRYMRDAFPNSKMIGFTGTPLMKMEKNTINIFGDYNHKYLMNDSVEDGTTVPIYYEMRKLHLDLNEEYLMIMDKTQKDYIKSLDENDISSKQKINEIEKKSVVISQILEDEKIIRAKSEDIIKHLKERQKVLHGKSMIIAYSRLAAYSDFLKLRI